MTEHDDLPDQLERYARLRRSSKSRRALTVGWRIAAIKAARCTGVRLPVVASTFWGDRMHVLLPEPLSSELFGYRFFEEGLSAFMLSELGPGECVYDVGAHYGYFTRLASTLVGRRGAVHSFEPTPTTFALLTRNTGDLSNVTCNQAAVWHAATSLRLNDFGPTMSMFNSIMAPRLKVADSLEAADIEVQALALDDYASRCGAPDFVKIDAESAEWHILQGMGQLLNSDRPKITVEVGDYGVEGAPPSRALLDYVIAHGYAPFDYRDGRIRAHDLQDIYGYDNILLVAA